MRLEKLQFDGATWDITFEHYSIPDYVLETIPAEYREGITGATWEIIDGELGCVWLTESSRPYDLRAEYHAPSYWQPEIAHFN